MSLKSIPKYSHPGPAMELFIKNMVSIRCKLFVKAVLDRFQLHFKNVELGRVEIKEQINETEKQQLNSELQQYGFVLLDDHKTILIEQIKNIIVEMVHYSDSQPPIKFSAYLSEKLGHDYTYLSNLFSEVTGTSIKLFIISHKIEFAKEMLVYNDANLSEIANRLHYNSIQHLSYQFKKTTGLTPSYFKKMKHRKLCALDQL
jgi:AraC-like DNA-binding protein